MHLGKYKLEALNSTWAIMTFHRTLKNKLSRIASLKTLGILSLTAMALILYVHQSSHVVQMTKKNALIDYERKSNIQTSSSPSDRDANLSDRDANLSDRDVVKHEAQSCIHPTLSVNDPVMMKFYKKLPKVVCRGNKNWVYVENGTIRFTEETRKMHENMHCDYFPLIRGPGDYKISFGNPIKNIQDSDPLTSDFFKIICKDSKNKTYENVHAGIHINATIRERLTTTKPPPNGLGLSIAFLGFDSMSRMSWLRRMPKTRDYMVNELKAIELEGYNILGDGTPAALLPILTGKHEQELPEARRKFKGAKSVDDFPWLWKSFSKNGYVTSWADAQIGIAPFNYRLLGFEHSPADYFMRPFFLGADPLYRKYSINCHGSEARYMVWFNWFKDIFYMYKNDPKFMVHFYTPLSHDDNNKITVADDDMKSLIFNLEKDGYLNNTLLVVMADHGARFDTVRRTLSGKLEERMPYISFLFPPWFQSKYPQLIKNVKTNVHRLTTPFDLHETFKDFLKFDGAGIGDVKNRGISLFKEIPKSRTCTHADVAPHWCACLAWKTISPSDPNARRALQTALDTLNNFTEPYRSDCALLSVGNITMLSKMFARDEVLKFRKTKGDRGLVPIMSDRTMKADKIIYQLTFFTEPGHGEFEITLEHVQDSNKMFVNPKSISRINKYGSDPDCILNKNREIRQYCYCKDNVL